MNEHSLPVYTQMLIPINPPKTPELMEIRSTSKSQISGNEEQMAKGKDKRKDKTRKVER